MTTKTNISKGLVLIFLVLAVLSLGAPVLAQGQGASFPQLEVTASTAASVAIGVHGLHGYADSQDNENTAASPREPSRLSLICDPDNTAPSIAAFSIVEHSILNSASRLRRVGLAPWVGNPDGIVVGDELILDLFPGAWHVAIIDRVSINPQGTISVRGRLEDCPASYVLVSTHEGRTLASVRIPGQGLHYLILHEPATGQHYLAELDPGRTAELQPLPALLPPTISSEGESDALQLRARVAADLGPEDPATIDIMIVYTQAAREWADTYGGGIHNVIAQAMEKAELVLCNSGTGASVRLVHSAEIDYDEGQDSSETHILRLTSTSDGYLDEVHGWRDQYGADLVTLFAAVNDVGGVAWLTNDRNGLPAYAFSLTRVQQAGWTYTHIHEMGHNMGCHHHKAQSFQPGPTMWTNWPQNTWSAGWRWTGQDGAPYCSVMTYASGAYFPDGQTHSRVPHFSNPEIHYQGTPTGHPIDGDNARTIRDLKHIIAAYRESAAVKVSIDAPDDVVAGGEFTARIALDHVEGFGSCGFDLVYDPTVITVTDVGDGDIEGFTISVSPGDWSYVPPGTEDTGRIRVLATTAGAPAPGVTGGGYVARVHFVVLGTTGESSTIALDDLTMYNYLAQSIGTTTVDGAVEVVAPLVITGCGAAPNPTKVGYATAFSVSVSGGVEPYTYAWTFGDGNASAESASTHTYAPDAEGTHGISVTVTDFLGNVQTCTFDLMVNPPLSASDCQAIPNPTKVDYPVGFTVTVSGGVNGYTYLWDFGDGVTSTEVLPTHTYTVADTYTVIVTVWDDPGNEAICSFEVVVNEALAISDCQATPNATAVGCETAFGITARGGVGDYTYDWSFGDDSPVSTEESPTHTFITAGTYAVIVTVTDALGSTQTCGFDLIVNPALGIAVSELPDGEVGEEYYAALEASGGLGPHTWEATGLPNGLTCSQDGVFWGTPMGEVGEFAVTVTVADAMSKTDSVEFTLTISCKPGDVNMDGVVNAGDITKVKRIIFEMDDATPSADINGDGSVNAGDITAIKIIMFGLL